MSPYRSHIAPEATHWLSAARRQLAITVLVDAAQVLGLCLIAVVAVVLMCAWPSTMPTNCIVGYGQQCEAEAGR
jgi:hypothetical protein